MTTETDLLREAVELLTDVGAFGIWDDDGDQNSHLESRVRAFLAKIDAAKGEVPEGFTLVENRALSTARMALAHATTTHGELYRDAYESLLSASGRQDGAR